MRWIVSSSHECQLQYLFLCMTVWGISYYYHYALNQIKIQSAARGKNLLRLALHNNDEYILRFNVFMWIVWTWKATQKLVKRGTGRAKDAFGCMKSVLTYKQGVDQSKKIFWWRATSGEHFSTLGRVIAKRLLQEMEMWFWRRKKRHKDKWRSLGDGGRQTWQLMETMRR